MNRGMFVCSLLRYIFGSENDTWKNLLAKYLIGVFGLKLHMCYTHSIHATGIFTYMKTIQINQM